MRNNLILLILSLFIVPTYSEAAPISVDCPATAADDREFTLTTDPLGATCYAYGNGAGDLNATATDVMIVSGWSLIDKDGGSNELDNNFSVTGMGATSGTFTLSASLWTIWDQIAIGFVVGGGNEQHPDRDPKWVVFLLPDDETSGLWSNTPPQGGALSHAVLYGMDVPSTPVPEPASLLLLGTGLAAVVRRMRAKR